MRFRFENFELDTDRRELRRRSDVIALEPQVFDLLEYLVRHRHRVATRDDLLEAVWHGRIVSESTLSSRINAARAAISDDGTSQRLIRTLPRKGIRFVGEVHEECETRPQPAAAMDPQKSNPAVPTHDGPSIAVLPFTNMSGDAETEYFADGMAEEIITALSRCGGILVIARNSSFTYKGHAVDVRQVGRELSVDYVLEGSVRRLGNQLRITAQLIETGAGTHLWADRYDGTIGEVFELQDRIANIAAATIEPKLRFAEVERARSRAPANLVAYDLWLRAVWHASAFTQHDMALAQDYLDKALAIDPSYALAMASSAYYHAHCHFQGWVKEPDDKRGEVLNRAHAAVRLAKDDPNVYWQSAFAIWALEQNDVRALELFRRALDLNPNSVMTLTMTGWVESANGNPEFGRRLLERSQRLNPRPPRGWLNPTGLAITCLMEGNYREAIECCEKALSQNRRLGVPLRALAVALVNTGELERARQVVREALTTEPGITVSALGSRLPKNDHPAFKMYRDALLRAGMPE